MRLALALAVVLVAGCSAPAPAAPAPAHLAFATDSRGFMDGANVRWTFWIQNAAAVDSPPAHLDVFVRFSQGAVAIAADHAALDLPAVPGGQTQSFQATTPYRGWGDYSGVVNLTSSGTFVARDLFFFEQCQPRTLC